MSSKPEKIPRAVATERKKKKVYHVALELFKKKGYNHVTMKEIADKSGISEGSIFHFFGSKAGILSSFNDQMFSRALQYLELTDENLAQPVEAVRIASYTHAECVCELGPELMPMYYNDVPLNYERIMYIDDPDKAVALLYKDLYEFVLEAVRRGTLKLNVSPEQFTTMIYAYGNGLILLWTRCNGNLDMMSLTHSGIDTLLDSLTKK